uniref:S-formylglutathione hydrolase n=1 Tax=Picocystis salinarum TaxID=88271 RepID=A0A7S3UAL7_9CHLO|mmetsp:Transcript_858/g.5365  ORF Transcript_858/g.5365 Transcript_858/m.5365 type:complete len:282 (-) Transcript_858:947-1792(-)|eukprot:CAMPEP_0183826630 /NCGR_PEP_ID=MMETSP0807_2-20130328/1798_1 /TAXON_ID=88271 /ORGANISM="Picocystis salinarum, Strain CCMP1897" /LENGTH=281 /DNA_ID=CAMNT_0026071753 /DNA_START=188 /DNA_END=1033 /DNA_ORIENTATION=+
MEELSCVKAFGGYNRRYKHSSKVCGCDMTFHIYFPPQSDTKAVPVVYYLSGLTCTDENVIVKSGVQRQAAELGIAVIAPDTSPRGLNVDGESDSWDFGVGAGFYVNATNPKWKNWQMYEYVTEELPTLLGQKFGGLKLDLSNSAIMGHSMGGHGALVIALKNPGKFKSVSAFAPVSHPTQCPWGEKAFSNYLGEDREAWKEYDATELTLNYTGPAFPVLIDQGSCDSFFDVQLKVHDLAHALLLKKFPCSVRMQPGYDHSYFFIASFMADHMAWHAKALLH